MDGVWSSEIPCDPDERIWDSEGGMWESHCPGTTHTLGLSEMKAGEGLHPQC